MGEFFKGWKRRSGVAVLCVACLLAIGWGRSFWYVDKVFLPVSKAVSIEVSSMKSKFCFMKVLDPHKLEFSSAPLTDDTDHILSLLTADWSRTFCGVRVFSDIHARNAQTSGVVVPYWLPVVPMTILAAILLLVQTTPRKPAEPMCEKVV